jgi:hypothetical protein
VPVVSEQGSQPGGEGLGVFEGLQIAMEAKLALTEVAFQSDDKLAAKNLSEYGGWEESSESAMGPNESDRATIRRRPPHNGHAVKKPISVPRCWGSRATWRRVSALVCRVMFEFLIPGVEHRRAPEITREIFDRLDIAVYGSLFR